MQAQDRKKLRADILKEIATIEQELSRFTVKNPVVEGDYQSIFPKTDPSDTADEQAHSVTGYQEEKAVEQNLELRLKELKETLQQIEAGTYGLCNNCKQPIEAKRIQAMPVVSLCVDCAKKATLV